MEQKKRVEHGVDDLTFSLNDETAQKTEDWHNDWRGRIVVNGSLYYLNGYRKSDTWIAGKVVKAPADKQPQASAPQQNAKPLDDDIPFDL